MQVHIDTLKQLVTRFLKDGYYYKLDLKMIVL